MTETSNIKNRYNRIARYFDFLEKPMGTGGFSKWRKDILQQVAGNTLEVGVGTGKNIPFYPKNVNLTAIDFSKNMLQKAKKKYLNHSLAIEFIEMDVQNMAFEDNSFDTVVTSCVFCSVPDPIKGLHEIKRILKPDGQLLMLEHVRSNGKILGPLMDWFNFIPLNIIGANINRNTLENIKKAGFDDVNTTNLWSDIVKFFKIKNRK